MKKEPTDKKLEKIANKELYRMVSHGATIDIGSLDDDTTFYPEVDMSKWGGECCIKISHADKSKIKPYKKAKEKTTSNNLKIEVDVEGTGRKHRFSECSLEWDVEYSSAADLPSDDIERFELNTPDNLTWYHQGELTQEDLNDGCTRPENVINSYAGYFNKKHNEYETGKFGHIFRSKLIANDGEEVWVIQEIIDDTLCINIDRDWCNLHGFPIILDPTFGNEGQGASGNIFITGFPFAAITAFSATAGDTITAFSVWAFNTATVGMAAYTVSGGVPVSRLAAEETISLSGAYYRTLLQGDL